MELLQLQSEQYDEFRKYVPECFTDSASAIWTAFLTSLSNDQAMFLKECYDFKDNINVLTANTQGVTAWEDFLGLPNRPDLSLQARRGRLFSRMATKSDTVKTLKDVISSYIGSNDFSITEYYTYAEPASAFYYDVTLNVPETVGFIQSDLEQDLIRLQPAHAKLVQILDGFRYIYDTQTSDDSVTTQIINIFCSDISPCDNPDYIVA